MRMKVLVVDDEANVRRLVRLYLEKEGFSVIEAACGRSAMKMVDEENPDFIILDIMLPEVDGWEVCRRVRKERDTPILMLTAKGEEIDKITGLDIGADDYVTKPFSPGELVARIKAITRRAGQSEGGGTVLEFEHLQIRQDHRRVELDGSEIRLRPKEFDLLWFLASNSGAVFSREQILERVWGYDFFGDMRTVDAHVKRLRHKLHRETGPEYIHTVWGVGYKFEEKEN